MVRFIHIPDNNCNTTTANLNSGWDVAKMPLYLDTQLSFAFKRNEKKKIDARNENCQEKLPAANSRPWPEQKDKRSEYNTQHVGMNYSMGVATTNGPGVGSYWPPHHTHTHILHFGRPKII